MGIQGHHEMGSVPQDAGDGSGQDRTGAVLDEDPHAVGVGLLHRPRKVHRIDGLAGDGGGGGLPGRHIGAVSGIRVEAHVGNRRRVAIVDPVPFGLERSQRLAVHDHVETEIDGAVATHLVHHPKARRGVSTDDDVLVVVDDGDVDPLLALHGLLDGLQRSGDPVVPPVGRLALGQAPVSGGGPAFGGELVHVHLRVVDLGEHGVEVVPDTEGHEGIGLARGQTHGHVRLHAQDVARQARMGLADEGGAGELGRR